MAATASRNRPAGGSARDHALDAFRGIAIVGMVLVNLQGNGEAAYPLLAHAAWNGVTIADLVFPFFLVAMGLAVPLAIGRSGWFSILRRAILLFALGVFLGWLVHRPLGLVELRIAGVLQRIAIVYLLCAIVAKTTRGWRPAALLALVLLVVHALLLFVPAPGEAGSTLAPGGGLDGWLDRNFLPGRLYDKTFDPEGILSTLSAFASGLIGVAVQRARGRGELAIWFATALCLVTAFAIERVLPFNKPLWTPSYALLTAGLGLALWAALRWLRVGDNPLARLGSAALTLYVVHALLTALLVLRPGSRSLWEIAYNALGAFKLSPPGTSLLFAILAGGLSIAVTFGLQRRGWVLRA